MKTKCENVYTATGNNTPNRYVGSVSVDKIKSNNYDSFIFQSYDKKKKVKLSSVELNSMLKSKKLTPSRSKSDNTKIIGELALKKAGVKIEEINK